MTDIELIDTALSEGKEGIIVTDTHLLVPMRITGTGITTRHYTDDNGERKAYDIDRPLAEFTSERFLKACVGLPVVMFHPDNEDKKVDYNNYHDYIIGNVIKPYTKDNEVWGYARINDLKLIDALEHGIKSTSPMVDSLNIDTPEGLKEQFQSINHIAIVVKGRWDTDKPAIPNELIDINKGGIIMPEVKDDVKKADASTETVQNAVEDTAKKVDACVPDVKADESLLEKDVALDGKLLEAITELLSKLEEKEVETVVETPVVKPDEEDGTDKRDIIRRIMAIVGKEGASDFEGGKKEEVETVAKDAEKLAYNPSTASDKVDEAVNEKDENDKNELDKRLSSMVDEATLDMVVKRPTPRANETASQRMNRILTLNKDLVSDKYHFLVGKVDSASYELSKEAFADMETSFKKAVAKKQKEANKSKKQVTYADGTIVCDLLG